MDRYFTIMLIPERDKGVRSFKIPKIAFKGLTLFSVLIAILSIFIAYDYFQLLSQVNKNEHLTRENKQLKEQLQRFQIKISSLTNDIERIHIFEKKLRIISGLEAVKADTDQDKKKLLLKKIKPANKQSLFEDGQFDHLKQSSIYKKSNQFISLKNTYEQKIAANLGMQKGYSITKNWSSLTAQSFNLAHEYALFDYRFSHLKKYTSGLEAKVHELDQFLLDKQSFMNSTPTLIPATGWITSYYGPRMSPTSKRKRMHEGLDIGAKTGTSIIAPADGIVTFSGVKSGFGKFVQLNHGYGVETVYAHASRLLVKKGQKIKRGHKIARVGSTGSSTGPHLHYEVRINGTPVNPFYYIFNQHTVN